VSQVTFRLACKDSPDVGNLLARDVQGGAASQRRLDHPAQVEQVCNQLSFLEERGSQGTAGHSSCSTANDCSDPLPWLKQSHQFQGPDCVAR